MTDQLVEGEKVTPEPSPAPHSPAFTPSPSPGNGTDRLAAVPAVSREPARVQADPAPVPRRTRRHAQPKELAVITPAAPSETAADLTDEVLLPRHREPPPSGWRRALYQVSAGLLDLGPSAAESQRRALISQAQTPVAGGHHRVAVLSLKGGVGKTTTTVGLGATLASLRGDRVIAVDANPDRGTLSDKLHAEHTNTVRHLLANRSRIRRYGDLRCYTSQARSRLEVLASDRDPAVSEAFSAADYYQVAQLLEHYYSVCITDCGTGLLNSAMTGVLSLADQIVLVSSRSLDGARSASATLDWLDAHRHADLVSNAVVVISAVRAKGSGVNLTRLERHFQTRCRQLVRVPYDPHLEEGGEIDLDRLKPPTRDAYLQLAAAVGVGFNAAG